MIENLSPLTKQCTKKIVEQMENCFYKIQKDEENFYIGFFSYIKYKNKTVPVLITNNNLINEESKNSINVSLNNINKNIIFGDTIYNNKELDMSIIEIKENIKDNLHFLEIDDLLYTNEYQRYLDKETIYIIHYNDENNALITFDIINHINNIEIKKNNKLNLISKCSFIFNSYNNKIIGVSKNDSNKSNKYIFLKFLIDEFLTIYEYKEYINKFKLNNKYKYNQSLSNEINILIKVEENDINKEVYFLDNYEYKDNEGMVHYNDNLKELNLSNTELYVKNKKKEFKKYFIPERKGKYNVKLKFNINLTDCSYMFAGCEKIIEINFIYFNTKNVSNMKYMFHGCNNLKSLNLFLLDTQKVKDMSDMFSFCENLENLDLTSFNIENIINMNYMFYNCRNLKYLDTSFFEIKNDINVNHMFELCNKLNISSFIKKNESNNKYENVISILINIDKNDKKKEIYFLDNYEYKDNEGMIHYHDNLKELNEFNTKLYINDVENEYKECSETYSSIELRIKIDYKKFGKFININKEDKKYYHIYFNNNNEEIKRDYIKKDEKLKKL